MDESTSNFGHEAARQREDGTSLERDCALHACGERDPRKHPKNALWPKLKLSRSRLSLCRLCIACPCGAGPRPGTRPARPAGRPRPTRAGRRVRAQDGPVADAGPTPTPTWNYLIGSQRMSNVNSQFCHSHCSYLATHTRLTPETLPHGAAVDSVIRRNLRLEALMTGTQYQPSHSHTLAATQDDGQKLIY